MASDYGRQTAEAPTRFEWVDRSLVVVALASLAVTVLGGLVQIRYGTFPMTFETVLKTVFDPSVLLNPAVWQAFLLGAPLPEMSRQGIVVWNIRMPRVLTAAFVGINLGIAGAIFQAITRNELASPYILGVSHGAGFAILLTLVLFSSLSALLPLMAAVGGTGAFLVVYLIAWQGGTTPVRLVLAGIIVGTIFWSLQTGMFYLADNLGDVQSAIAWTTGSLTGVDWGQVRLLLPWTALTTLLAVVGARQLNVLVLGEQTANALGMRVERIRFGLSAVAIVATSTAIAAAGIVSFVGLVVPHLVRTLVGSDYRRVVVGCVFVGPAMMVLADVGARLALQPIQVPTGIVTGLIGGPYFLYLMRRRQQLGDL